MLSPEKSPLGCKFIKLNNFFVCGPKYTKFFRLTWEGLYISKSVSDLDLLIRSGDIRDQSLKLSKITKNFGRFFGVHKFWGGGPYKNCTQIITPASPSVDWKKSREDTPTNPEVIDLKMLNFRPNFYCRPLKFFGGTPVPVGVCAR